MESAAKKLLRRRARRVAELGLARVAPRVWRLGADRLLVLAYHRVLPPGHPDLETEQSGMWVHPETLRSHIRLLRQHFELVDLESWLVAPRRGGPCCALTFDDGWLDNYAYGFPVLRAEAAPATIFLVSDFVGTGRDFWPGRLVRLIRGAAALGIDLDRHPALAFLQPLRTGPISTRQEHLDRLVFDAKALPDAELHARIDEAGRALGVATEPAQPVLLGWSEIEEMAASGLIRFGSHGKSHQRLCAPLDPETQCHEARASSTALQERAPAYSRVFCYPNGDSSPEADAEVRRSYLGACIGAKGWNRRGDDPFRLRRVLIHEDVSCDRSAFLARVSGVL